MISKKQAKEIAKDSVSGNRLFRNPDTHVFSEDDKLIVIELSAEKAEDITYRVKIDKKKRKVLEIERI